jgi:hypothetical protein
MPVLVIDGRDVSWEELGRMLMTFEGWQFRMEIRDRSEEVWVLARRCGLQDPRKNIPSLALVCRGQVRAPRNPATPAQNPSGTLRVL